MFRHLILGLLRDGKPRHGYELVTEYKARTTNQANTGSFYRELQRLARDGLVYNGVNPPGADARRIPYQITEKGCEVFDSWLLAAPGAPATGQEDDLSVRLLFVDQAPPEVLDRLLDRWQEELWLRGKLLGRARADALSHFGCGRLSRRYDLLPSLLSRRLKHIAADVEFLKEFRIEFEEWKRREAEQDERGDPPVGRCEEKGRGRK